MSSLKALGTGALTVFGLLGTAAATGTATTGGHLTTVIYCAGAVSALGTLTGDLTAELVGERVWRIQRDGAVVATGLPGMTEAVLAMLALLDRGLPHKRAR